jgi:hypothetical protein
MPPASMQGGIFFAGARRLFTGEAGPRAGVLVILAIFHVSLWKFPAVLV